MKSLRRRVPAGLWVVLGALWAGGGPAWGQLFQLYPERMNAPEAGDFTINRLLTERQMFSFFQLPDWELRREGTNRSLLFTAADLSAGIRIRLTEGTNASVAALEPAQWRQEVLARIPDSRLVQEFPCYADGRAGVAFDLVREAQHSTQAVFRVALVPYPGGLAEFELRTTTNYMVRARRALGVLMSSFRVEARSADR
jgi:hypothetical protein